MQFGRTLAKLIHKGVAAVVLLNETSRKTEDIKFLVLLENQGHRGYNLEPKTAFPDMKEISVLEFWSIPGGGGGGGLTVESQ